MKVFVILLALAMVFAEQESRELESSTCELDKSCFDCKSNSQTVC